MLWGIGTHFQPKYASGRLDVNAAQDNIAVMKTLGTQCQAAMHFAVSAVLDNNVRAGTVIIVLVSPCALAAFQYYSIIVDVHIASVNEYVFANIEVNSIARRSTPLGINGRNILRWRIDKTSQVAHVLATI